MISNKLDPSHYERLREIRDWCRSELDASLTFWLTHGIDRVNGGIYTCLDRSGMRYSSDKSVWMQGRCAWMFSYLCHLYGKRPEWMQAAQSCLTFLESYCINKDAEGRMYFTVTAEGKPLRQRRYCFSEGFYAIACAEYFGLTQELCYLQRARKAYQLIYDLNNGIISDPCGLGPKTIPETRATLSLADPMIFLNIISILRRVDPERTELYDTHAKECTDRIVNFHYRPELGATLESVNTKGEPELCYSAGRVVNPGHDIECSWFLFDEANYRHDKTLHGIAQEVFRLAFHAGWDKEYGGLLYFIDAKGLPTEAYEHDMKLWWPHNETMIASAKAFRDTGNLEYLTCLFKTVEYCKSHFCDTTYGEWYGYLRRDGLPTLPATKGSTFKGPFHVPRALSMTERVLTELIGD